MLVFKVEDSSFVECLAYETKTRVLVTKFKRGRTYKYDGVSPQVFRNLTNAESKGKFLNLHIIGQYECTELISVKESA